MARVTCRGTQPLPNKSNQVSTRQLNALPLCEHCMEIECISRLVQTVAMAGQQAAHAQYSDFPLNPRPAGGRGADPAPSLPDFLDCLKTSVDIDAKL